MQIIGVRSTRIGLLDGNVLTVPNAELANSRVVTYRVLTARSEVKLIIKLGSDVDRATALLGAVAAEDARVRSSSVRVTNVTPQGIELTVAFETANGAEALAAEHELRRQALLRSSRRRGLGWPTSTSRRRACPRARRYKRRGRCRS